MDKQTRWAFAEFSVVNGVAVDGDVMTLYIRRFHGGSRSRFEVDETTGGGPTGARNGDEVTGAGL